VEYRLKNLTECRNGANMRSRALSTLLPLQNFKHCKLYMAQERNGRLPFVY